MVPEHSNRVSIGMEVRNGVDATAEPPQVAVVRRHWRFGGHSGADNPPWQRRCSALNERPRLRIIDRAIYGGLVRHEKSCDLLLDCRDGSFSRWLISQWPRAPGTRMSSNLAMCRSGGKPPRTAERYFRRVLVASRVALRRTCTVCDLAKSITAIWSSSPPRLFVTADGLSSSSPDFLLVC